MTEDEKKDELTRRVARAICAADGYSSVFTHYIDHYTRLAKAALAVVKVVEPLDWIIGGSDVH